MSQWLVPSMLLLNNNRLIEMLTSSTNWWRQTNKHVKQTTLPNQWLWIWTLEWYWRDTQVQLLIPLSLTGIFQAFPQVHRANAWIILKLRPCSLTFSSLLTEKCSTRDLNSQIYYGLHWKKKRRKYS